MKKIFTFILCMFLLINMVACEFIDSTDSSTSTEEAPNAILSVYKEAVELGYEGSLEEFLSLVKGEDGLDGKDGKDGVNGKDGNDGRGITKTEINNNGDLVVYYTDGTEQNLGKVVGENGKDYNNSLDLYKQAKIIVSNFQQQFISAPAHDPNIVDIAIFAGQSNSVGRAQKSDAKTDKDIFLSVPINNGFTFQTSTNGTCTPELKEICEPIIPNGGGTQYHGYIPAFINTYNQVTGRKICACFKSSGGTSLHQWFPFVLDSNGNETSTTTTFYASMINSVNSSKQYLEANGYTVGDVFLVWCQGENDAAYLGSETASNYCTEYGTTRKTNEQKIEYYNKGFTRIVEKLKEDVGLTTAFIIRIGHSGNKVLRNEVIIQAQNKLCRENPNCVMVSTIFAGAKDFIEEDGTKRDLMRDASHYLPEGYLRAGMEAGINAGIYQNSNKTVKPILIEYNTLYKEGTANQQDTMQYENEVDKYIYYPNKIDINFLKQFEIKE